uniref:Phtf-FEM1B_bdg domain-containing protein n=1 Tax=Mesocestoides corti TaxID=53468 RepID=A0A5K3F817_MESCO
MRGIPDPEVFAKYRSKQLKTNVGGGGQQLSPRLKNTSKWMSHLPDMLEAGAMTIEAEEEKEEEEDDDDDGGGDESEDEEPHNLAEGEATFIPHDLNSNSNDKSKARSHERPDSSKNGIRTSGVSTMLSNEGDNGISGLKTEELEKQKSSAEDEEFEATDTFNTRRRQRAKFLRLFWERACSHRHQQRPPLQAPHVSTAVEETLRQQPISCQPGVSGHWSPDGGSLTETSRNLHLAVGSTTTSKKPVTQFRSGSNASQKRAAAQVARAKVISFRPTAATTTTTTAACADPMAHAASETECDRMNSDLGSEYDSSSVSDEERLGSRGHLDQLPAAAAASATTQPSSASEMPATTSSTRHAIHHHHHPTFALHVRTVGLDDAVGSSVSPTNLPDVSPKHGGGGAGGVGGGGGVSGDLVDEDAEDPFALWYMRAFQGISDPSSGPLETVWCYIWEGRKLKKVNLTLLDIGWSIIQAVERQTVSLFYPKLSCVLALQMALLPLVFHAWYSQSPEGAHTTPSVPLGPWFETDLVRSRRDNHSRNPLDTPGVLALSLYYWISDLVTKVFFASPEYLNNLVGQNMWFRGISLDRLVIGLGIWLRLNIYGVVFFLLCVAERSFQQRLLYAKHFFALTSSHRARKCRIPHFRLNKVAHVKCWLTLRSYLKKQGPQRSIECIITAAFYLAFAFGLFFCAQFLMGKPSRRSGVFSSLATWDILAYTASVSVFLLRFLTLGTKITKKYRNVSVLITEQMNLYLSMEKKPHKKEEFSITNQVLRLAENLLKEVDGPYRICGWAVNPLVYNVFKLVLLSCFSAFISEFLGFKLKLYKLKLNPANW